MGDIDYKKRNTIKEKYFLNLNIHCILKRFLIAIIFLIVPIFSFGQNTDDFRTRNHKNGNWINDNSWERYVGWPSYKWNNTNLYPNYEDGAITIGSSSIITLNGNLTVDQLIIEGGATLIIPSGYTLTIRNGNGTDMTIDGILTVSGTLSINTDATITNNGTTTIDGTVYNSGAVTNNGTLTFNSGSTYNHARDGGTIPTATWDVNSTCYITGCTDNAPGGYNQNFGNFTWECAQDTYLSLGGATTSIQGNLSIARTGSGNNDFAIEGNITIGGNLNVSGNPSIYRLCYNQNRTQTVLGNVNIQGGTLLMNSSDDGSGDVGTLNVNGQFSITSGTLNFGYTGRCTNAGDNGIIYVKGDFTHTGGTITEEGNATGCAINFNGSSMQTYTSGGTVSNTINYNVYSGAYLQMANASTTITGGGYFTLDNGGTLGITSTNGITTSGATGNIQLTGSRTYNTGANYIYNGPNAQVTGNGLTGAANLTISNNSGVSLSSSVPVGNTLTLSAGQLILGGNNLTINNEVSGSPFDNSKMITINGTGNLIRNYSSTGTFVFPVGSPSVYSPVEITANNASAGSINVNLITSNDMSAVYDTYLSRLWTITAPNISNYNITCTYVDDDFEGTGLETDLVGGKFDTEWVFYDPVNAASNQFTISGLTSFSSFSAAAGKPEVIASASPTTVCAGGAVSLSAIANHLTPVSWSWTSNPTGFTSSSQNPTADPSETTTYTVTVTDNKGKTYSDVVTVTVNPLPQGSLTANGPFCTSGAGQLTWTATTDIGPYTVVYNDGTADRTALNVASGTAFDVFTSTVTSTTTYSLVSVTDNNGCVRTTGFNGGSATISLNSVNGGTISSDQTICSGGNPTTISIFSSSGSGALSYRWESSTTDCSNDFSPISGATSVSYDPPAGLTQTTYYRRVTISTLNGVACEANSDCMTVTVYPTPNVTVTNITQAPTANDSINGNGSWVGDICPDLLPPDFKPENGSYDPGATYVDFRIDRIHSNGDWLFAYTTADGINVNILETTYTGDVSTPTLSSLEVLCGNNNKVYIRFKIDNVENLTVTFDFFFLYIFDSQNCDNVYEVHYIQIIDPMPAVGSFE